MNAIQQENAIENAIENEKHSLKYIIIHYMMLLLFITYLFFGYSALNWMSLTSSGSGSGVARTFQESDGSVNYHDGTGYVYNAKFGSDGALEWETIATPSSSSSISILGVAQRVIYTFLFITLLIILMVISATVVATSISNAPNISQDRGVYNGLLLFALALILFFLTKTRFSSRTISIGIITVEFLLYFRYLLCFIVAKISKNNNTKDMKYINIHVFIFLLIASSIVYGGSVFNSFQEKEAKAVYEYTAHLEVFDSWRDIKSGHYIDYVGEDFSDDEDYEPIFFVRYLSVDDLNETSYPKTEILEKVIFNKKEYKGYNEISKVIDSIQPNVSYYFEINKYIDTSNMTLNLDKTKNFDFEIARHNYTGQLEILDTWIEYKNTVEPVPLRNPEIGKDYSDDEDYARAFYIEYLSQAKKEEEKKEKEKEKIAENPLYHFQSRPERAFLYKVIYNKQEYTGYGEIAEIIDLIDPNTNYYFESYYGDYYGDNGNNFYHVELLTLNLDKTYDFSKRK